MGEKLVESMDFNGKGVDTVVRAVALSGGAESGGDAVQRPGRLDGRFLGGGGARAGAAVGRGRERFGGEASLEGSGPTH